MANKSLGDPFTVDPAAIQRYNRKTDSLFSIFPESKPVSSELPFHLAESPSIMLFSKERLVHVFNVSFKVLLFLASIAICVIALKLCFSSNDATTNNEKFTGTEYCSGTGWVPYRDETCFKFIKKWATRQDAARFCREERLSDDSENPHLANIKNAEEQAFLSKLLFADSEPNVWIGLQRKNKTANDDEYVWEDDSHLTYLNMAHSDVDLSLAFKCCTEMHKTVGDKGDASFDGKWRHVSCEQVNYFVCQKVQRWPLEKLQRAFLSSRRDLQQANEKLANLFPIGFIYIQLPHHRSPAELWPQSSWLDVSTNYSGVFFRVQGGGAGGFGDIQEENAGGQIESVEFIPGHWFINPGEEYSKVDINLGKCSSVHSGGSDNTKTSLEFCTRKGEIRPRNMAVKIWERLQ